MNMLIVKILSILVGCRITDEQWCKSYEECTAFSTEECLEIVGNEDFPKLIKECETPISTVNASCEERHELFKECTLRLPSTERCFEERPTGILCCHYMIMGNVELYQSDENGYSEEMQTLCNEISTELVDRYQVYAPLPYNE